MVLLTTPIGLVAVPLAGLLGLLIAVGVLWAVLSPVCSKYPRAALGVLGVLLVTAPVVVFPLLLYQSPPAPWYIPLTTLVIVVFFVWPLVQRLSIDPLRATVTDPTGKDTLTAGSPEPTVAADQPQEP
jgi:hypothetical protein